MRHVVSPPRSTSTSTVDGTRTVRGCLLVAVAELYRTAAGDSLPMLPSIQPARTHHAPRAIHCSPPWRRARKVEPTPPSHPHPPSSKLPCYPFISFHPPHLPGGAPAKSSPLKDSLMGQQPMSPAVTLTDAGDTCGRTDRRFVTMRPQRGPANPMLAPGPNPCPARVRTCMRPAAAPPSPAAGSIQMCREAVTDSAGSV